MIINLIAPEDRSKWKPIWKKCYKKWLSSPYEIRLWGDKEIDSLLKEDNNEFYHKLSECPNIYKYDYVRYLILDKVGGAYFDMDVEIIRDFIPLLNENRLYLYGGYSNTGVEPCIMVRGEKYPYYFFAALQTYIQTRIDDLKISNTWENTPWKTGPLALTSFYLNWIKDDQCDDHTNKNIQILPWELFGQTYNDLRYAVHHYTNNWWAGIQ